MRTYLDCFPCFLNQALRAAKIATDDAQKIKSVFDAANEVLYIGDNADEEDG